MSRIGGGRPELFKGFRSAYAEALGNLKPPTRRRISLPDQLGRSPVQNYSNYLDALAFSTPSNKWAVFLRGERARYSSPDNNQPTPFLAQGIFNNGVAGISVLTDRLTPGENLSHILADGSIATWTPEGVDPDTSKVSERIVALIPRLPYLGGDKSEAIRISEAVSGQVTPESIRAVIEVFTTSFGAAINEADDNSLIDSGFTIYIFDRHTGGESSPDVNEGYGFIISRANQSGRREKLYEVYPKS